MRGDATPDTAGGRLGVRGGLSIDHLVAVGRDAAFDQLGGPGLYAALGGRLVGGTEVRLITDLPDDDERFELLFDELGIDVWHSRAVPSVPRVWILDSPQGRRIVETTAPSDLELEDAESPSEAGEVPLPPLGEASDGLDALLDSSPLERARVGSSTLVGVDPHQLPLRREGLGYLRRVLTRGGTVLPSRVQLRLLDPDPRAAARRIARELGAQVVARLDREGMYVVTGDGCWTVCDPAVQVRETTGAGDASAAAIMAALAQGADLVTAAHFGVSVARIALAGTGSSALAAASPLTHPFPDIRSNQES
ncbi:PfkB family carbohydrate kinase [Herbiconiux sp. A18JL235]|uniref:PfkB family carbohydrate kinase n=1 Tax=Herbiconiux sp. A18JL235 TaxID=3152363 RepID=A0AB39BDY1_9MICO